MKPSKVIPKKTKLSENRNSISEWFGFRVAPSVCDSEDARRWQSSHGCPFLTTALRSSTPVPCVKSEKALGVCTISSGSNGSLQDWVVCPYRVLTSPIFSHAAERLFGFAKDSFDLLPADALASEVTRQTVLSNLKSGKPTCVVFMDKTGGEISLPGGQSSPEFSLDGTVIELVYLEGRIQLGRYLVIEVQTMDFHGSYQHAVRDLSDGLRLHSDDFAAQVVANPNWASNKIEGPNISNVFKRTIYQILFKLRLGKQPECVGCVLALPRSVWESWRPHLGNPAISNLPDGSSAFDISPLIQGEKQPGWLYVFDIDQNSASAPNPVLVSKEIRISVESLSKLAFDLAPAEAMKQVGGDVGLKDIIRRRLIKFWPQGFSTLQAD